MSSIRQANLWGMIRTTYLYLFLPVLLPDELPALLPQLALPLYSGSICSLPAG
jgi:hypothetical protein